ncbi:MAG: UDP-N-acetylmuramoyl-L-alanyl-D-glutamate--2,6-diaminopimelate ligase [bacterium]|nr:UDP-N-acetylmuramoyl-L-alanyl-D-glutamate--2,6-diaminopimelate ligase [bacterium]
MVRRLKNLSHFFRALLAVIFYRFPARDLTVIGVTGTDGKTTTVHLIGAILREAGIKVATISTLGAYLGNEKVQTGFHVTTPNPWLIQRLLRQAVNKGFTHVVLEATSHGLDQHRLLGCNFEVGVITNVTREHLDYHGTYEKYLEAKSKLLCGGRVAIINKEDRSYERLEVRCKRYKVKTLSYGLKNGDYTPKNFSFKTKLPGEYNLYNCLAAIAVAKSLKIEDQTIKNAIETFDSLPGRMEEVETGKDFKVFVDFAHTPAAFERVLETVRSMTKGRIIHVFGCTGDRDKTKRLAMGETSARLSDKIILTSEDTYSEDPGTIIESIETGVKKGGKVEKKGYWKVSDREEAIKMAVEMARKNDSVLLTGVGHQTTLNVGGREIHWSEKEVVERAIRGDSK